MDDRDDSAAISCANCKACCCKLEVLLIGDADVPVEFTTQNPWGGWVMRRLDDGWCAALDRKTFRCTIYESRPDICRDYEMGDSDCLAERAQLAGQPTARRIELAVAESVQP